MILADRKLLYLDPTYRYLTYLLFLAKIQRWIENENLLFFNTSSWFNDSCNGLLFKYEKLFKTRQLKMKRFYEKCLKAFAILLSLYKFVHLKKKGFAFRKSNIQVFTLSIHTFINSNNIDSRFLSLSTYLHL